MVINRTFSKIHISLHRDLSQPVLDALAGIGVTGVHREAGRSLQLTHARGLRKLLSSAQPLDEEPTAVFSFLAPPDLERPLLNWLGGRLGFGLPGRGSVYAKTVTLVAAGEDWQEDRLTVPESASRVVSTGLTGIVCVVQKGQANPVARIGLTTGTAIPGITFGTGTGLRNRLGTWRILIPAEKEVSTLVMDASEAEAVMDMMVDVGQLDQPGKGFIYLFPVSSGVLDTQFQVGTVSHAASIEQIVSALDEITGTTEWRRKSLARSADPGKHRKYLTGLVDFSLVCNEGMGEHFTQVAMAAGAAGATYRKLKRVSLDGREPAGSPAREVSEMTIGAGQVEKVAAALDEAGLYLPEACGEVHTNPVPKACTFLGK